jgi:hypothetical protein
MCGMQARTIFVSDWNVKSNLEESVRIGICHISRAINYISLASVTRDPRIATTVLTLF